MQWRKSKVIYNQFVNRELKSTTEAYLHFSISLGDVEAQCAEKLKKRIRSGIEMVDGAAKVKLTHVIFHPMQQEDHFYEMKIAEWVDDKKSTYTYLVPALSPKQAIERITAFVGDSVRVWRVTAQKESDILAVWKASDELWTGDWYNRMDRYDDEGKHDRGTSVEEPEEQEPPQMDLFDDDSAEGKKAKAKARRIFNAMLKKTGKQGVTVSFKGSQDKKYRRAN